MINDIFTFLIGGKAGEGVKKAGAVAAQIFSSKGRQVFQMDDYMSLIRGGHNFSVISTATRWISSQYMKAELIVNFDKRSYDNHASRLAEDGIIVFNSDEKGDMEGVGVPFTKEAKKYPKPDLMLGVGAIAVLAASIGIQKSDLNEIIKNEYSSGVKDNVSYANTIYDYVYPKIGGAFKLSEGDKKRTIAFGNQLIGLGAIAGGLDVYYAYPMTPSSSLLHFLASVADQFGLAVIHPESEVAVINMAVGSAVSGARTMVGTSGGGFALMVEGFSLAGMIEAPILCILGMRPGPATGLPTYTAQGELNFALSAGHGEFLRIVAAPGTIEEAYRLSAEMLNLVWKFQTPGILLVDKHLAECSMTVDINIEEAKWAEPIMHVDGKYNRYLDTATGISPMLFPPSKEVIKWNSHEHDEHGITTENPKITTQMNDKRNKKLKAIQDDLKKFKTINVYGEKGPLIFTYGSVTMSLLEAIRYGDLAVRVVQPIYLSPLPVWELDRYKTQEVIVVEQSCTGQFATLLKEKAGMITREEIRQYDGRPFDPIELYNQLKEVI